MTARSQKHGVTRARIVLGWHLGVSNTMISKSTHPNRMRENLTAAEIVLTRAELDAIVALDWGTRIGADPAEAAFTQM